MTGFRKHKPRFHGAKTLRTLVLSPRVLDSLTRSDVTFLEKLERAGRIGLDECDAERALWLVYFGFVSILVDPADRVYIVSDRDAMTDWRETQRRHSKLTISQ